MELAFITTLLEYSAVPLIRPEVPPGHPNLGKLCAALPSYLAPWRTTLAKAPVRSICVENHAHPGRTISANWRKRAASTALVATIQRSNVAGGGTENLSSTSPVFLTREKHFNKNIEELESEKPVNSNDRIHEQRKLTATTTKS
ncbi:hypothetical protein SELMODRAFT_421582 [Selaginella moellendorffii]|uniref:Uncharacterized protein n=1 Tax=Selaginella moellendorffii TaxID=88036 RepID=D8SFQ4_SELML|nr:hypothetical protein SELMODRAFT_421582 [Selaginella moellendorffii]